MNATFLAFDAAEYLDSEQAIAAYLNEVIEDGDPDLLLSALSDIARARGMTRVAEDSGLGRDSLYKALRPGAKPGFVSVSKIMGALGLRVIAEPMAIVKKPKFPSEKRTIKSKKAAAPKMPEDGKGGLGKLAPKN